MARIKTFGLIVIVALVSLSCASPVSASEPVNVSVTNLRADSFTVVWTTAQAEKGMVELVDGSLYYDDRGADFEGFTHHVTVSGLGPETDYAFAVLSGGRVDDNSGEHWAVTTGPTLAPPATDVIAGRVVNPDGSVSTDAIVFVRVVHNQGRGTSAPLSTAIGAGDDGIFRVDLGLARLLEGTQYFVYSRDGDRFMNNAVSIQIAGAGGTAATDLDTADATLRSDQQDPTLVVHLSGSPLATPGETSPAASELSTVDTPSASPLTLPVSGTNALDWPAVAGILILLLAGVVRSAPSRQRSQRRV